jgi:hypothetical protein
MVVEKIDIGNSEALSDRQLRPLSGHQLGTLIATIKGPEATDAGVRLYPLAPHDIGGAAVRPDVQLELQAVTSSEGGS